MVNYEDRRELIDDPSQLSPSEREWYKKMLAKLGYRWLTDALIYHTEMYKVKERIQAGASREEQIRLFLTHNVMGVPSAKQRPVLRAILEKVIDGEDFPDF